MKPKPLKNMATADGDASAALRGLLQPIATEEQKAVEQYLLRNFSISPQQAKRLAMGKYEEILKANPYHDHKGQFTSKDKASHTSEWAEFGSPAKMSKVMENREERIKLFDKHLEELRDDGVVFSHVADGALTSKSMTAEQWDKAVGGTVSPKELVHGMFGSAGSKDGLSFRYSEEGKSLRMKAEGLTVHGIKTKTVERTFYFHSNVVSHDYFEIERGEQGKGAAKAMFKHAVPIYKKMGLNGIMVTANLDAGGYAWARFGFKMTNRGDAMELAAHAEKQWRYLGQGNHPEAKAVKEVLSKLKANARDDKNWEDIPHQLASMHTPALSEHLRKGDKKAVSKVLLRNSNWSGKLHFSDSESMSRLAKYVGLKRPKKKTV